MYGVATRDLNKAVKLNLDRFPEDFMFQLNSAEYKNLMFQFGRSRWGGTRKLPYAFTELGVAMLSSVLNSKRAIQMNIQIMRTFVEIRELLATHKELARKLEELETKYDKRFQVVFDVIKQLIRSTEKENIKPKREIGFRIGESIAKYVAKRVN